MSIEETPLVKSIMVTPEVKEYKQTQGSICPILLSDNVLAEPLHGIQEEIVKYFTKPLIDDYEVFTFLMSRRLGKSYLATRLATTMMIQPHTKIAYISHSTSLSDEIMGNVYRELTKIPAIRDKVNIRKKEGIITIDELNARFICSSHLNAESRLVGKGNNIIFFDEFYLIDLEYQARLMNLLKPTITTYGRNSKGISIGKIIILSTPRGVASNSTAGRIYLDGLAGKKGHINFTADIYKSPFLTDEEIEALRLETPEDIWNQEYLCKFSTSTKTVFPAFDEEKHIVSMSKKELRAFARDSILICGMDMGARDGNAFSAILYNERQDKYLVIDEHYAKGEITRDYGKAIMKILGNIWAEDLGLNKDNTIFWIDPSCLETRIELSRDYDITIHKAKNQKTAGLDFVNQLLQGKGDAKIPQLQFLDTCQIHIDMFRYAEFKTVAGVVTNQFARDMSPRQSHFDLCDTVYYTCYSHHKTAHNSIIIA